MFDDIKKNLYLVECKSTKGTSLPFTMVRQSQIDGLSDASKHNLVAGFLVNFRNENNDTFFITIEEYIDMVNFINKKSFNIKDLKTIGAVYVDSTKKRVRYTYDIKKLLKEICL